MSDETFSSYAEAESTSGGKFWECKVEGSDLHIRYGKVGQVKAWTTKSFASHELALKEAKKKLKSKVSKGYVEQDRGEGGESSGPKQYSFEERWGELRSLTEGKESKASVTTIKRHFEAMWGEDHERTREEVLPFLRDKLKGWKASHFTHTIKQTGCNKQWSKATAPLLDDKALDDAPFALFSRGLVFKFDGRYMPGDDVELTPYMEKNWVSPEPNVRGLASSEAARNLERFDAVYTSLCEMQQYSCPVSTSDLQQLLVAMPSLQHIRVQKSWSIGGFPKVFDDERITARLKSLDLLMSPLQVGDLQAMVEREAFSELETLALDGQIYAASRSANASELHALFTSEHMSNLTELTLAGLTPDTIDADLATALAEGPFGSTLKTLRIVSGGISYDGLAVLLSHENLKKLKTLDLFRTLKPDHVNALEEAPEKLRVKQIITHDIDGAWDWQDEARQRFHDWATSRKVKHKAYRVWPLSEDY